MTTDTTIDLPYDDYQPQYQQQQYQQQEKQQKQQSRDRKLGIILGLVAVGLGINRYNKLNNQATEESTSSTSNETTQSPTTQSGTTQSGSSTSSTGTTQSLTTGTTSQRIFCTNRNIPQTRVIDGQTYHIKFCDEFDNINTLIFPIPGTSGQHTSDYVNTSTGKWYVINRNVDWSRNNTVIENSVLKLKLDHNNSNTISTGHLGMLTYGFKYGYTEMRAILPKTEDCGLWTRPLLADPPEHDIELFGNQPGRTDGKTLQLSKLCSERDDSTCQGYCFEHTNCTCCTGSNRCPTGTGGGGNPILNTKPVCTWNGNQYVHTCPQSTNRPCHYTGMAFNNGTVWWNDWHIYGILWTSTKLSIYIDNILRFTSNGGTKAHTTPDYIQVMNLAGATPGFHDTCFIDYVRNYEL